MASILWVLVIFLVASFGLYSLTQNIPLNDSTVHLKFPTTFQELTNLAEILEYYKTDHSKYLLLIFSCAYLYKQTFAIPGSVFLNVLAGALFGAKIGFLLVCSLSGIGASFCYLLSKHFGQAAVIYYFPEKIQHLQRLITENKDSLLFYMLFLRIFPLSPNWFINISSPLLNVPLPIFFTTVFIGLMPYNFICIQTGCMLTQISSIDEMFSLQTLCQLVAIACVALLPGLLIKRMKKPQ